LVINRLVVEVEFNSFQKVEAWENLGLSGSRFLPFLQVKWK